MNSKTAANMATTFPTAGTRETYECEVLFIEELLDTLRARIAYIQDGDVERINRNNAIVLGEVRQRLGSAMEALDALDLNHI